MVKYQFDDQKFVVAFSGLQQFSRQVVIFWSKAWPPVITFHRMATMAHGGDSWEWDMDHSNTLVNHHNKQPWWETPLQQGQKTERKTRVPNARVLIVAFNLSEPCRSFFAPRKKDSLHHKDVFNKFLVASSTIWACRGSQSFFVGKNRFQTQPRLWERNLT